MLDSPAKEETPLSGPTRQQVPSRFQFAAAILLGLLLLVLATGFMSRAMSARRTEKWTQDLLIPTVRLVIIKGAKGDGFILPAEIQAQASATIYAQISGYVQNWLVDIGSSVKAGDVLAQIDPKPYRAALDQARGQLARDIASLEEAQLNLKRYESLAKQGAISAQQLTNQQSSVRSNYGTVQADEAAVEIAKINLGYTRIVAPFNGVITSRAVDVGQLVAAGSTSPTPLFTVSDSSKLRVYVRVPQNYSTLLRNGMTVTFSVPEYPSRAFTATLVASAGAITSQSGTQLVQFQIENTDHALKPGSYAQVNFRDAGNVIAASIPATALLFRDQGMLVATVGNDNKVALKPVHIATDLGSTVEVDAGIANGDRIIDNPPDSLLEGDTVRVAVSDG